MKEKRALLGDFVYDSAQGEEYKYGARETRELTQLESGAKYKGEWLKGTQTR